MPVRGLLLASGVLALLAGAAYWSDRNKPDGESSDPNAPPKLVTLPEADIQQIEVRREGTPPVLVEKDKGGKWQMKWPEPLRVNQDAAGSIASTYATLAVDRLIEEKPADLSMYGLATPASDIRITSKDGKKHRLLIGSEAPAGGYYAKLEGDARVFKIATGTKTSLDKSHRDLRDKKLLSFDSEKLTRVQLTAKGKTIEFEKKGSAWQIVRPSPMRADTLQVDELIRSLQDASMDPAIDPEAKATFPRVATAIVTDASGTQQIEFFKKDDSHFARSSTLTGLYKLTAAPSAIDKEFEAYRNKKLFDFAFNEPSKIEFRDEAKSIVFAKSGEKWSMDGKPADVVGVQSLIDRLRDLSATSFVPGGFGTAIVDVTVVSEGRTEKVSIAKMGERFLARRESEPQVYELDAAAVADLRKAASEVKPPPPAPK